MKNQISYTALREAEAMHTSWLRSELKLRHAYHRGSLRVRVKRAVAALRAIRSVLNTTKYTLVVPG